MVDTTTVQCRQFIFAYCAGRTVYFVYSNYCVSCKSSNVPFSRWSHQRPMRTDRLFFPVQIQMVRSCCCRQRPSGMNSLTNDDFQQGKNDDTPTVRRSPPTIAKILLKDNNWPRARYSPYGRVKMGWMTKKAHYKSPLQRSRATHTRYSKIETLFYARLVRWTFIIYWVVFVYSPRARTVAHTHTHTHTHTYTSILYYTIWHVPSYILYWCACGDNTQDRGGWVEVGGAK